MGIDKDFKKFRELMLMEEFKNCLPSKIKILKRTEDDNTITSSRAVISDNYSVIQLFSYTLVIFWKNYTIQRERKEANCI